jgi:hypothetical protein
MKRLSNREEKLAKTGNITKSNARTTAKHNFPNQDARKQIHHSLSIPAI